MKSSIPNTAKINPSNFVIFGGGGDLSTRKIIPALFWRFVDKQIDDKSNIIICLHKKTKLETLSNLIKPHIFNSIKSDKTLQKQWNEFHKLLSLITLDLITGDGINDLTLLLNKNSNKKQICIFYLAISSNLFETTCNLIRKSKLNSSHSRVVVEKPIGFNKESAIEINENLYKTFKEEQIYRIDHYLGKETVQNLMALRFANTFFENQWDNKNIENVQITVAEEIGVADRISYYNEYGAIRDMVQNHLLQLLCLVAMEPPSYFDANQVRDEKLRILKSLRQLSDDEIGRAHV